MQFFVEQGAADGGNGADTMDALHDLCFLQGLIGKQVAILDVVFFEIVPGQVEIRQAIYEVSDSGYL